MRNFHNDWDTVMEHEMSQPYFKDLMERVKQQYLSSTVYPPHSQIFRAMEETPYHSVKVVIIGQDPYHGKGQAEGLSFSVRPGVTVPPSLRNIYKELASDVGAVSPIMVPCSYGLVKVYYCSMRCLRSGKGSRDLTPE